MRALPSINAIRSSRMSKKTIAVIGVWTLVTGLAVYGAHKEDQAEALTTTPYVEESAPKPYHDEDTLVIPDGSIEPGLWDYLLEHGWKGRPDDGMEALYPPYLPECWEAEYNEVLFVC